MLSFINRTFASAAKIAALVPSPYSIACWSVGYAAFRLTGGTRTDADGSRFREMVLRAPLNTPRWAASLAQIRREFVHRATRDADAERLKSFIAEQFRLAGFTIAFPNLSPGQIAATCSPEQLDTPTQLEKYAETWADVFAALGDTPFSPRFRFTVSPCEPLNREWARDYNCRRWTEIIRPQCASCDGTYGDAQVQFGTHDEHASARASLHVSRAICPTCIVARRAVHDLEVDMPVS